jgi:hypothetical protein
MPARSNQRPPLAWRKSSASNEEECVEVARLDDTVLVRDSLDRAGAILAFSPAEWRGLVRRIRGGWAAHI